MSPHGDAVAVGNRAGADDGRRCFMRNSAIGTLILCALSGWLLFPRRRPSNPASDWAIAAVLAVLVLSSIYQLIWLETSVLH